MKDTETTQKSGTVLICKRCGSSWHQRFNRTPTVCGICHSAFWAKEYVYKKQSVRAKQRV